MTHMIAVGEKTGITQQILDRAAKAEYRAIGKVL